jgi:magnesium transporter
MVRMKIFKKPKILQHETLGLPPGTPVYTGEKTEIPTTIEIFIYYNEGEFIKKENVDLQDLKSLEFKPEYTYWINVVGLQETDKIQKIGEIFNLHSLTVEDIVNVEERPKIEEFDDYLFLIIKEILFDDETLSLDLKHVSVVLKENVLITFKEEKTGIFDYLIKRIEKASGKIRKRKSDYLCFAVMDLIIDHYFAVFEKLGEILEDMEDKVLENPDKELIGKINHLKKQLIFVRKNVWPLREIINQIIKSEFKFIEEPTKIYFRDAYDHTIQIVDTVESYRDILSGILDVYLSSLSNKMNEIMKTLSIIGTIFIPLTFIAGNYGMNFKYMPELQWHYGYFAVLFSYLIISGGLIIFFKKRKWF